MSTSDFNNGLITGLALKGIPYGVTVSWQPKSVTNDDTQSITIDFDRYIPDIEIENYIDALYFIATYIQDQFVIRINGWERVNQSTIKFLLDNYFSCNGIVTIIYNTKQGNLDSLPSFVVNYSPKGVPIIIYYKVKLDKILSSNYIHLLNDFDINCLANTFEVDFEDIQDNLSNSVTVVPVSLTHTFNSDYVETIFE